MEWGCSAPVRGDSTCKDLGVGENNDIFMDLKETRVPIVQRWGPGTMRPERRGESRPHRAF